MANEQPALNNPQEGQTDHEEATSTESKSGFYIPPWVAIAFGILTVLLAFIIIRAVAAPLWDLLFVGDPEVPVPPGARLESEIEDPSYASHEWLYQTQLSGCEVADYYVEQGADCRRSPFACSADNVQIEREGFFEVAICTYSEDNQVGGYSWEIRITSGFEEPAPTRFRVFLYD